MATPTRPESDPALQQLAETLTADLGGRPLDPTLCQTLLRKLVEKGWRPAGAEGATSGSGTTPTTVAAVPGSVAGPPGEAVPALDPRAEAEGLLPLLQGPTRPDLNTLLGRWMNRNATRWPDAPDVYRLLGERFVKLGCPLAAYDVCAEGLVRSPGNVRLRQVMALALARSGATHRARALLQELVHGGEDSEETLGLLARTDKDLWMQTADPALRKQLLEQAAANYLWAYKRSGGYWTGINAATMTFLAGRRDEAADLARAIKPACLADYEKAKGANQDTYWALATLGEVALILGERADAARWYAEAAERGRGRYGDLSSTRRNARLLLRHLGDPGADIERCFAIPPVAVFAGWIRGGEFVSPPILTSEVEDALRKEIRRRFGGGTFSLAYAGASAPVEWLFLETIRDMQGDTAVVFNQAAPPAPGELPDVGDGSAGTRQRLGSLLSRAAEVLTASDQRILDAEVAREFAELFLMGVARLRARQLETDLVPVIVCEDTFDRVSAAAARVWHRFERLGLKAELLPLGRVDPARARELLHREAARLSAGGPAHPGHAFAADADGSGSGSGTGSTTEPAADRGYPTVIRALLFGDAFHFSKLTEEQIPRFHGEFLGAVGRLITRSPHAPTVKNTWGDGLYFVFDTVRAAGLFALDLCDLINGIDWAAKGLPETMNLRVALHAGPVLACTDPVTHTPTYMGTHVSRAARIEPITPVGQVYSSQAFAALAAAEDIREFGCEYVGQTPLAKGFGTFPTYHVRRTQS